MTYLLHRINRTVIANNAPYLGHQTADFGAPAVDAALDQLAEIRGAVRDELGVGRAA